MASLLAKLKNVVWTALLALVAGWLTLLASLLGAGIEIVAGLGIFAVVMALLAQKTS